MRTLFIAIALLAVAKIASPPPASCYGCRDGMQCFTSSVCGDCRCLRPGGLTEPGFCG